MKTTKMTPIAANAHGRDNRPSAVLRRRPERAVGAGVAAVAGSVIMLLKLQ